MNSSQHQHIYTLFILVPRNNRSLGIMRVLFCNDRGEVGDQRRLANGEGGTAGFFFAERGILLRGEGRKEEVVI